MTKHNKKSDPENRSNEANNRSDTTTNPAKHSRFQLIRYGTWILYVIYVGLVISQQVIPFPQFEEKQFAAYHVCIQQGTNICGRFENIFTDAYFDIPLYLTSVDRSSIVQFHEVKLASFGGFVSKSLAEGLESISIKYAGSIPFDDTADSTTLYFTGVTLTPTAVEGSDLSDLVGDPISIKWQFEGDYYPVVVLNYQNFTSFSYPFPDAQIHVQSELDFITSVIEYQALLLVIGAVVPAIAEGIHQLRKNK